MKNSLKIFLLLLTYVLIAVCTFGIVTYIYQVPVPYISKPDYQLYGGIGAGVLGLILGFIAAFSKNRTAKETVKAAPVAEKTEEQETAEPAETAEPEEPAESAVENIGVAPVVEPVAETLSEPAAEELPWEKMTSEEVAEPEVEEVKIDETETADIPVEEEGTPQEEVIEPDDITKAFAPVIEPVESLTAPIPTVIVSPLGPRNFRKEEIVEEKISDEELASILRSDDDIPEVQETMEEISAETEEPVTKTVEETYEPELQPAISETQENFISDSRVSYIDDEGKPQFVITQNIETVKEVNPEEQKKNFVGYDVQAERRARMSLFISRILTFILIALLLYGIYYVYTHYLN